jgi:hypothetical protein
MCSLDAQVAGSQACFSPTHRYFLNPITVNSALMELTDSSVDDRMGIHRTGVTLERMSNRAGIV